MARPRASVLVLGAVCTASLAANAWFLVRPAAGDPPLASRAGIERPDASRVAAAPPRPVAPAPVGGTRTSPLAVERVDPSAEAKAACEQLRMARDMQRSVAIAREAQATVHQPTPEELRRDGSQAQVLEMLGLPHDQEELLLQALSEAHVDYQQSIRAGTFPAPSPDDLAVVHVASALGPEMGQRYQRALWTTRTRPYVDSVVLALANSGEPLTTAQHAYLMDAYMQSLKAEEARPPEPASFLGDVTDTTSASMIEYIDAQRRRIQAPVLEQAASVLDARQLEILQAESRKADRLADDAILSAKEADARQLELYRQGGCL